jgi:hypothetical protein
MLAAPPRAPAAEPPTVRAAWTLGWLALAVVGLYADGWAHNHLVSDAPVFPRPGSSRPGPPHFATGLSLWHLPYLLGLVGAALSTLFRWARFRIGGQKPPPQTAYDVAAALLAVAAWLWGTASGAARTPGTSFLRLESLPGLVGPPALLQAGALVWLAWSAAAAGWPRVLGGLLVLSTFTYLTQFLHPYVDPWPSAGFLRTGLQTYRYGLFYFGEAVGLASLVLQASLVAGVVVALLRSGPLPPGAFTVLVGLNGTLVTSLRGQFAFVAAACATGLVADLLAARLRRAQSRELPVLAACVGFAYAATSFLVVAQLGAVDVLYGTGGGFAVPNVAGLGWSAQMWTGTCLVAGAAGWLLGWLASPPSGQDRASGGRGY